MQFYVAAPDVRPTQYELTDKAPEPTRFGWRGYRFAPTPEFVVHSRMHGSHDKPQPYVLRGVDKSGRLLVQTLVETQYDKLGSWHEIDGEYTTEGYRFKRYTLKPFLTLLKLATNAAKARTRVEKKAAKQGERDEKCGICPCCFGDYVVHAKVVRGLGFGGREQYSMVHHGYERPGVGYIVGDCHGVGFEPFEISCEGTKSWLMVIKRALTVRQDELAYLNTRDEITVDIKIRRGWGGKTEIEKKIIKRGEDGFERAIEERRYELTSTIKKIKHDIAEYSKKIAEWKPQTFPRVVKKGKMS